MSDNSLSNRRIFWLDDEAFLSSGGLRFPYSLHHLNHGRAGIDKTASAEAVQPLRLLQKNIPGRRAGETQPPTSRYRRGGMVMTLPEPGGGSGVDRASSITDWLRVERSGMTRVLNALITFGDSPIIM